LVLIVPLLTIIINFIDKKVLYWLAEFEKHQSYPTRIYKTAVFMMVSTLLNTGAVILIVHFRIETKLPIPILQGGFKEFSVEWYNLVGSTICVNMVY